MTSLRNKYITTFIVFYSSFAVGIAFFFLSPAVIDFSTKFGTTVDQVSHTFTINSITYICGSLAGGIFYKYVNRQFVIIILLTAMSLCLMFLPLSPSLTVFFIMSGIIGFSLGGCDTGLITWCLDIWRNECAPYVLTQNFVFGIGTFVPPLILEPFLTHELITGQNSTTTTTTTLAPIPSPDNSNVAPPNNLILPFALGGIIIGASSIMLIVHFFTLRKEEAISTQEKDPLLSKLEDGATSQEIKTKAADAKFRLVILVILSCIVLGFYQSMELTTIQFLPTFSVYSKALSLSEAQGAQISFGMTMSFAISRGLGIFIAFKMLPELMLLTNFIFLVVANIILMFFAQDSLIMLWTASILLGIGLSTVWPCYYAYIEKHLHITDFINSTFLVFGGSLSGLYPYLVGKWIEQHPSILCYVNFTSIIASTLAFSMTYYLTVIKR